MSLVVDASVACKWFVEENDSPAAEVLIDASEGLIAPTMIVAEVANVLWSKHRTGQISTEQAVLGLENLPKFFSQLVPRLTLAPRALALAMELDYPVYDCLYLALAEARNAPLVTADSKFFRRLSRTRWRELLRWL